MTIKLYRTHQRRDDEVIVEVNGDTLSINGQSYDLSGVQGPEDLGNDLVRQPVFRQGGSVHVLVVAAVAAGEEFPEDDEAPAPPAIPVPPGPAVPSLFATVSLSIVGGALVTIELVAQLASAYYEDGWMTVALTQPLDNTNYLVFVQTDIPAKVEQYKDLGSFELIFSDPATGGPVEPGRIDLQLLKVTR